MRRRFPDSRPTTAAEAVALWVRAKDDARQMCLNPEQAREYVGAVLRQHGTDVVEVIRARRELRRLSR